MKKIIIQLLINLIHLLNKKRVDMGTTELPLIVADKKFLQIAMPNGEIIPGQIDLVIKQPLSSNGFAVAEVTMFVKFDNLIAK